MLKGYKEYLENSGSAITSEQQVLEHIGLVHKTAIHLKARLPDSVDLEELVQIGMVGLLEASKSYDPARGDDLAKFASSRIRGAILDEVRKRSPLSRNDNNYVKSEDDAIAAFMSRQGRPPSTPELIAELDITADEYHKKRSRKNHFNASSYEELEEGGTSFSNKTPAPEEAVEREEMLEALTGKISNLTIREQQVLSLYYSQSMNLREIGAIIDVTESRVSQILSGAVNILRTSFTD
jgi:RNA polymerase sigma factor for flagellar operon FliA